MSYYNEFMEREREKPRSKISIIIGDDGEHTFPCVTLLTAVNLLSPLKTTAALKLLNESGVLNKAVSRVSGTPRRKGTHQLIPVSELIRLRPDLEDILQSPENADGIFKLY